jgi:hypothetical protein
MCSNHKICILTRNGKEIVLLGEKHYKDKKTSDLCDRIINKFQYIGYENCKYPHGILYFLIRKIMMYIHDRESSIYSKKIFLGFLCKSTININDNECYEIICDNGKKITFSSKDLNDNNTKIMDLEKQDKPLLRQYLMSYNYDCSIIFLLVIIYSVLIGKKIPLSLTIITNILSLYHYIEIFLFWIFSNKSYELKTKITYAFPMWDYIYRRDKIMADNINKYINKNIQFRDNVHKKKMLAVFGRNHLEGIKHYLIKNHNFIMQCEMSLEDYAIKIETE